MMIPYLLTKTEKLLKEIPVKCKVCESNSHYFASAKLLQKYDVDYFQCSHCGFVQTEEPYWLNEAYLEAIALSDVGLLYRNNMMANITGNLLFNYFNHEAKFLDYGGGYGIFVRLMRDQGFDFYWQDKYCQNLFATGFELKEKDKSELLLITAFELFEHLIHPLQELEEMLKLAPNLFFSTSLLPDNNPTPDQWWYYTLHEGQHIVIYTRKSLEILAKKYNLKLYTDGSSLHLLTTNKDLPENLFYLIKKGEVENPKKVSFLISDFNQVVSNILARDSLFNANQLASSPELKSPIILIDGVFFQLYQTGIARVWKSLLQQWANTDFANHILFLDRANSAPKINGIRYRTIHPYDYNNTEGDKQRLQQICDEEGAELFISTYYTTPIDTSSVFMAYDMIPEVLGGDLNQPMWVEKHRGIHHASAVIAISENTAKDIHTYFPEIPLESITVAHCGVDSLFSPASETEIQNFKYKYGINKPYFLLGGLGGYKNAILFFQAFAQLANKTGFDIVATGAGSQFPPEWRQFTAGCMFHSLQLSDKELRLAYTGAVALVYPSQYEGFGMPVIEAMACACPVITTPNASLPEVGGDAALYVNDDDVEAMTHALCNIQKPDLRQQLIQAGLQQARKFSWYKMATIIQAVLFQTISSIQQQSDINFIIFPNWQSSEKILISEVSQVIRQLIQNKDTQSVTLFVETTPIGAEQAELVLTDILLSLTLEENLSISDQFYIHYLDNLTLQHWESICLSLLARFQLQSENTEAITNAQLEYLLTLSLSRSNYLVCPDWQQDSDVIAKNLLDLLSSLPTHLEGTSGSIIIYVPKNVLEQATEIFLETMLHLAMENDLDLENQWNISLFPELSEGQWNTLLRFIEARLPLPYENVEIAKLCEAYNISLLSV
jgi:glycosyltransferase involved in cell wall biosynthesis